MLQKFSVTKVNNTQRLFQFNVIKLQTPGKLASGLTYLLSVVLALSIGGLFLFFYGHDPIEVYWETFSRVFGTWHGLFETLVKATPLYFGAFGVAVAARMQLWNIGVEGQFLMGAFAATGVALYMSSYPPVILISCMVLAAFIGGAFLGIIAAIPRAYLGISEIITTLLFNYIVVLWISYFVHGPWKDPGTSVPQTPEFVSAARLPIIILSSRVHLGIVFAVVVAVLIYLTLNHTVWGYEVRAAGDNLRASKSAGIKIEKNILILLMISGGLAGIGGMVEVAGAFHRLQSGIFPLYTLTAFMIAWLARLNILGIFIVGYFVAGLLVSGYIMQMMGLPGALVNIIQGIILFSTIAFALLPYYRIKIRVNFRTK